MQKSNLTTTDVTHCQSGFYWECLVFHELCQVLWLRKLNADHPAMSVKPSHGSLMCFLPSGIRKKSFGTHRNNRIALFYPLACQHGDQTPPRRLKWEGRVWQIIQKALSRNFFQILWEMPCPQSFLVQEVSSLCKSSSSLSILWATLG